MATFHSNTVEEADEAELAAIIGYALLLEANPSAAPSYVPRVVVETTDWLYGEEADE